MSIHDDAEGARRAVYDDALAERDAKILELQGLLANSVASEAMAEADLAAANATIVALRAEIVTLQARIAELENPTTPPGTTYPARRSGPGYVAIEDLGVTIDAAGLMEGAKKTAAQGKQITLPANFPLITDFKYGSVGNYFAGLFFDESTGSRITGLAGTVDTATGDPVTKIGLVPMSSRFTASSSLSGTGNTTHSQLAVIRSALAGKFILQDIIGQGSKQPHFYHGLRTEDGVSETIIENVIANAWSQGNANMPPGETYPFGVQNPTMRKVRMSGKLDGALQSSTLIGVFGNMSDIEIDEASDMWAGFPVVFWATTGTHRLLLRKVSRPGTGPGGKNGNLFNVEEASGIYNIEIGDINLDGAWPNPLIGDPPTRKYPTKPAPRHEGKFPHFIVINTKSRATKKPTINVDFTGTYDTVGFTPGGLGWMADHTDAIVNARIKGGPILLNMYRAKWWEDPAGFDPTKHINKFDEAAQSTPWG